MTATTDLEPCATCGGRPCWCECPAKVAGPDGAPDLAPWPDDLDAELEDLADEMVAAVPRRRVVFTPASSIVPRPVVWAWQDRIAAGSLVLWAGREGTGKSQAATWLTAQVTRGTLDGTWHGASHAVVYVAAEDSWAHTIVPRLIAADADLDLVYRAEVATEEYADGTLSLPADLAALERSLIEHEVALVVVDPLLSTISTTIDSTRDNRGVRSVLEPLVKVADRTGVVMLGLAHFNKGGGTDASSRITGSGAFKDVARAVFAFARDEESGARVMSQTKNSLGREDLPSLAYGIEPHVVPTPEGEALVSRLVWQGESDRSVSDMLRDADTGSEARSERDEAVDWLRAYIDEHGTATSTGLEVAASDIFKAAKSDGIADRTLKRARTRLGATSERRGFGAGAVWVVPHSGHHSGRSCQPLEAGPNGPNGGPDGAPADVSASVIDMFPGATEVDQ